ncbi:MAG: hypothetical protein ACJAX8_001717, partial [Flavobacteriales bacterium]
MKLVGMLFGVICGLSCFGQSVYINSVIEQGTSMGISPCEPSIAVSQKDPAYMVAGAILDKVYTSSDSGMTWTIATLKSRFGVFGDPCIVASPKGGF